MTSIMLGDLVYVMITILGASVRDAGRDRQGGAAPPPSHLAGKIFLFRSLKQQNFKIWPHPGVLEITLKCLRPFPGKFPAGALGFSVCYYDVGRFSVRYDYSVTRVGLSRNYDVRRFSVRHDYVGTRLKSTS